MALTLRDRMDKAKALKTMEIMLKQLEEEKALKVQLEDQLEELKTQLARSRRVLKRLVITGLGEPQTLEAKKFLKSGRT